MHKLVTIFFCTYFGRLEDMFKIVEFDVKDNKVYTKTGEEADIELIEKDNKIFVVNTDNDISYEFGRGYYPHGMKHKAQVEGLGRYIAFVESPERAKLFRDSCLKNPPYMNQEGWEIPEVLKPIAVDGIELPAVVVEAMKKVDTIKLKNTKEMKIEKLSDEDIKLIVKVNKDVVEQDKKAVQQQRDARGRFVSTL